ncbi:MAG: hypothetical protein Q4E16_07130 [Neisseria sp.]|nr:hypothetical protein [Neisseria sp.]
MNDPFFITWRHFFTHNSNTPSSDLRQQLKHAGTDARRLSRQTMLALLANHGCPPLPNDSAVCVGIDFGSPSVFQQMQQNVAANIAKPFDLLAHLHNAPAFHVAQQHQLTGANVVQIVGNSPSKWQIFNTAYQLLSQHSHVLLLLCYEAATPEISPQEGCLALLLSTMPSADSCDCTQNKCDIRISRSQASASEMPNDYFSACQTLWQQLNHADLDLRLPTGFGDVWHLRHE